MPETIDCNPEIPIDNFPKLSKQALTGILGEIVELACENSEASPAAVFFTALTFAAASIGAISYFPVGDTRHPARFFACIVGESARARKGTSSHPVERIFQEAQELHKLPLLPVTPGPFSSGEGIINAVRDPSEILKKGAPIDMGVSDKRLLGLLGEFGGTLSTMTRDGSTLSSVLRTAWETGNIKPLTKLSQIKTTGAHINFVGHITKQELQHLLSTSDIWNGLANRILWVCAKREKLVPVSEPMNAEKVRTIATKLGTALTFAQKAGRIIFNQEAEAEWKRLYPEITSDKPGVFGVITARAEAQIVRLAMVYAMLDQSYFIELQHLKAALSAWEYCEQSARYLFGSAHENPRVLKVIKALESGPKSTTALHHVFGRNMSGEELKSILTDMENQQLITSRQDGKSARIYKLIDNDN